MNSQEYSFYMNRGIFYSEHRETLSYYITRKTPTEIAEIRLTNKLMTNKQAHAAVVVMEE